MASTIRLHTFLAALDDPLPRCLGPLVREEVEATLGGEARIIHGGATDVRESSRLDDIREIGWGQRDGVDVPLHRVRIGRLEVAGTSQR